MVHTKDSVDGQPTLKASPLPVKSISAQRNAVSVLESLNYPGCSFSPVINQRNSQAPTTAKVEPIPPTPYFKLMVPEPLCCRQTGRIGVARLVLTLPGPNAGVRDLEWLQQQQSLQSRSRAASDCQGRCRVGWAVMWVCF
jgi:hypothetical protein